MRNDQLSGLILAALAAFVVWVNRTYPLGTLNDPGPGYTPLVIAACEAGKHVYLEKPIASSTADGARVVDAAARAGVTVMLGFNRRFHPLYEQARQLIQDGRLGDIRAVQTTFCEPAAPDAMPEWKRHRATGGGVG